MNILVTSMGTPRALNPKDLSGWRLRAIDKEAHGAGDAKALDKASRDFEALFVRQLLTVMRRSVPEGDPNSKAPGTELYTAMMDEAFAEQISRSGRGLGLAELLMDQMRRQEGVLDELSHAK